MLCISKYNQHKKKHGRQRKDILAIATKINIQGQMCLGLWQIQIAGMAMVAILDLTSMSKNLVKY